MRFTSVIFDLDGTILETSEGIRNSLEYAEAKTGFSVEHGDIRPFIGPPLAAIIKERSELTDDQVAEFIVHFRQNNSTRGYKQAALYPGIVELFQSIHAAGARVYIATSKPEQIARAAAGHFGFTQHIDFLAGASMDHTRSSKIEVLTYLFENCDIAKNKAVMIGDRKYDLIGGKTVGIATIGVSYGFAMPGELEEFAPYAIARDTGELGRILLG